MTTALIGSIKGPKGDTGAQGAAGVGAMFGQQVGSTTITPVANTPTSKTITFVPGRFTQPPVLVLGLVSSVPGTTVTGIGYTSPTTTGVTLWVTRTNVTDTVITWYAMQVLDASATG